MAAQPPLFQVETDTCGTVILTQERWDHACFRHPEVAPYMEQLSLTLTGPNLVYETNYQKPTRSFYARGLIEEPLYKGCYVAVFVRYTMETPCVWTAYLPSHLSSNPGTLLYADM